GTKALAINRNGLHQHCRREMRGEGKGQAQIGRELRAKGAGAEDPDRHVQTSPRNGLYGLARRSRLEIVHQFHYLAREALLTSEERAPYRARGDLVGTPCSAETEIDPPGMQRRKRAELLGN